MFKLNSSELKKMFLRPAVIVMLFVLAIVLVVSAMIYHPSTRENIQSDFGGNNQTIGIAFSSFQNGDTPNSKKYLDAKLLNAKEIVSAYSSSDSFYNILSTNISSISNSLNHSENGSIYYALMQYLMEQHEGTRTQLTTAIEDIKTYADNLFGACRDINSNLIDVFITNSNIDSIKNFAKNLFLNFPSIESIDQMIIDTQTSSSKINLINEILKSFRDQCSSIEHILANSQKIEISAEEIDKLVNTYYTQIAFDENSESLLTKKYTNISNFSLINNNKTDDVTTAEFNGMTTEYRAITDISSTLLLNNFTKTKIGNMSAQELKKYYGFENINLYSLQEEITLNQFLFDNQMFDGTYLVNFNFSTTSGYSESAYDFCIYAMQILGIVLAVFTMFFAISIMAGDFQNGSIKMLATRPISRTHIVAGKMLACINLLLIFSLFCLIASFVVGVAMFGLGSGGTLVAVLGGTTAFATSPIIMLAIYYVTFIISILFYVFIAMLLATLTRSTALSLLLSTVIYVAGLILSAVCGSTTWFMFTPFAYLDLFKFFGNASASGGFLTFTSPNGLGLLLSIVVFMLMIIIIDIITKLIFKKRDIT